MQHQEFEPYEALQDTIKCFWHNKREFGPIESGFEVIPDGYAEIIFHFGNGCKAFYNGKLQPLPSPFMIGLLNQPVHFYAKNQLEILAIRCFPWTVFDLLGLSADKEELHIFEHPLAQLQPVLSDLVKQDRIKEAIEQLQTFLLNLRSGIATDSLLFKAGAAMQGANGAIQVSEVATAAHATLRTLERNFKQSSGYTVKDVAGLMRFEQVRNQLWLNPSANIASLAHEFGYTDQPHLSREFKRYSGTTPAAFARKAKKGKKLVSNNFVAFIQG